MSRKANKRQNGGGLFPFLAVLLCTMGALVVLLVVLVQQTRVGASVIAAAKSGGGDVETQRRIRERMEDAQWQREMLEKSRAEKTDELAQARSRVAHLEEHTQRLESQAKELLERAKGIDEGKKLRDEDMAAARVEAAKLKAEIEKKKDEIEKAKKKAPDGQEWYALIPYDGRSGTRRRPIYVECTEFGVVIQPEGLRLTTEDFSGPLGPGNPLDSALRAIRDYWERTAETKAGQPYPLLVVRPSGVVAFGAAKAAISAWDDEWGYELISDDKNLDFGQPDPALNATLNKSVSVARQRQAAMIAMMPRRFQGEEPLRSFAPEPTIGVNSSRYVGGTGGGNGIGGSGVGSGGVGMGSGGGSGGSDGAAKTVQPGGGMARGGYGNGLGGGNGGLSAGSNTSGGGANSNGGIGYGGAGSFAGGGGMGGYGSGAGAAGNANGIGGNGYGSGSNGSGYGANGTGNVGSATGGASGAGGSGIPSVASAWNTSGAQGDQRFGATNRNEPGMIGAGGGGSGNEAFSGSQAGGDGTNGGGNGSGGGYGTSSGQNGSGQYAASPAGRSGGASGGANQFGSPTGGQPAGGDPFGGSSGAAGGSSSASGGGSQGGGSPFSGGSSMTSSSGGMGVPSLNFGSKQNTQGGASGGKAGNGGPRSTAKRGNNWGLPQAKTNSIGVTRPIHISIEPNRVVMYPERGDNRAPKVVPIAPELSPDDVTHFVDAVQGEVKGWGVAVSDGYWKPLLRADIAPGAERQYMNLETALHGSGIELTRR